jgi:hypothetical protein
MFCKKDKIDINVILHLYDTLYTIAGSEWSSFEDPGLIFGGTAKGKRRTYFLVASPSI